MEKEQKDDIQVISEEKVAEKLVFFNQWTNRPKTAPQEFKLPTCTIPDQSMTIAQIIERFTRTGLVPQSFAQRDKGGNIAADPDSDPLDDWSEVMAAKAREEALAHGSAEAAPAAASGEPANIPPTSESAASGDA